ncbi:MAG: DUF4465 domain-containing protein [Bacteroidia bacterium]|nr:DUF4465 domain-containing protein [Bacteroidia bacterium]
MANFVISAFSQKVRFNISTFETVKLQKKGYYNGDDMQKTFVNGHFIYRLSYDSVWKSWSGIAITNHTDTITNSYNNEYSSITGQGYNGSKNYGVCYNSGTIICTEPTKLLGFYISNTTYTFNIIKSGSAFSKKFGGVNGNDTDWFRVKIVSFYKGKKNDSLYHYLADYRFSDNSKDYISKKWERVDLSVFDKFTDSLRISFESTDNGTWGMNTPAYMAFDDFNSSSKMNGFLNFNDTLLYKNGNVWNGEKDTSGGFDFNGMYFENNYNTKWNTWGGWAVSKDNDTTKSGFDAQYSSITGQKFIAVSYGRSVIKLPPQLEYLTYRAFYFSNNSYTYKTMKNGDAFSKKFGGIDGTDKDFLKLNIIKYYENEKCDTSVIYLADYRNSIKILSSNEIKTGFNLYGVKRLEFQLESTDNGTWGMNTPAYFCLRSIDYDISINKKQKLKMMVFPNPANEFLISSISYFDSYKITDITGKDVTSETSRESNKIEINRLSKGIFLIEISNGSEIYYSRFVK